jgi:hypothetical protein
MVVGFVVGRQRRRRTMMCNTSQDSALQKWKRHMEAMASEKRDAVAACLCVNGCFSLWGSRGSEQKVDIIPSHAIYAILLADGCCHD